MTISIFGLIAVITSVLMVGFSFGMILASLLHRRQDRQLAELVRQQQARSRSIRAALNAIREKE